VAQSLGSLADAAGVVSPAVVAFVGAGGKTTALRLLAAELASRGGRVVVTTTTAMWMKEAAAVGPVVMLGDEGVAPAGAAAALAGGRPVVLVRGESPAGKAVGLSRAEADALWAAGIADAVVVEADGSRGLPFKAFGPHEPQVPSVATTVVVVAGLDALGVPLTEDRVHRAALLADFVRARLGAPVTAGVLAEGLRCQVTRVRRPRGGPRVVVLLNKAELPGARAAGLEIARDLLDPAEVSGGSAGGASPDRVVVGSLREGWYLVRRSEGRR